MGRATVTAGAAALVLAGMTALGVAGVAQGPARPKPNQPPPLVSPDDKVKLAIAVNASGQLTWSASLEQTPVIDPSPLGIVVDGTNLGAGVAIGGGGPYRVNERYDWVGVHSRAVNSANGTRVSVRHLASGRYFTVDARAADDYALQAAGARPAHDHRRRAGVQPPPMRAGGGFVVRFTR